MSFEQVKSRPGVRLSVSEAIAALALVATVFSISQAWWILPEKVSRVEVENEKQEARLQKIEATAADRAETLARIDERTKRIEQILANRP
ncbi:MAG: hypothetical protein NTW41_05515 [Verrucomicrobia bacterium]|nr:hypothetical protein [Verrucomicrobiota bacterium]